MEYVKKKFVDEENRVISWFSTDDNVLCSDGKTLREKIDGENITYISPQSLDEFVELTKEGGLFYLLTTIPIVYNNTTYNVVGFVDSRPHSNGYSYYAFHKMWQFLINPDTKEIEKFSSFSEFIQKKIPSDASKLSIIDANNNFTSTNVEGALEELKNSSCSGGVAVSSIEPALMDMPRIFFSEGTLPTNKTATMMRFDYYSKTAEYHGWAEIKCQGNSSMSYPKKNFTIKLYKDKNKTKKLKINFKGWGAQSKFVLKANWIDLTHARNDVSARIWADIVKSRSGYANLPELLRTSPNQGAVDGFPVTVYGNGYYQGRYTLNIPKDKWMSNMDDSLDTHCILCGENYASGCFRATANINGNDWTDELHDVVPANIKTRWNECISFVMNSTDEEFKTNLHNYFDVDSLIDYLLYGIESCGFDAFGKNQIYFTYDGQKWIASMYDMDSTWGLWWNGSQFVATDYPRESFEDFNGSGRQGNLLYIRLQKLFVNEIKSRYAELKQTIFTYPYLVNKFEEFVQICPQDIVKEDYASTTANGAYTNIPSKTTNNIQQIRSYIKARLDYVDSYINSLTPPVLSVPCTGITLNANSLVFEHSTTPQTLTATLTPSNTSDSVVWSVSPTGICTVNNGVVTPVSNGSCIITATCGTQSASCNVNVNIDVQDISVTALSLDKDNLNLGKSSNLLEGVSYTEKANGDIIFDSILLDKGIYEFKNSTDSSFTYLGVTADNGCKFEPCGNSTNSIKFIVNEDSVPCVLNCFKNNVDTNIPDKMILYKIANITFGNILDFTKVGNGYFSGNRVNNITPSDTDSYGYVDVDPTKKYAIKTDISLETETSYAFTYAISGGYFYNAKTYKNNKLFAFVPNEFPSLYFTGANKIWWSGNDSAVGITNAHVVEVEVEKLSNSETKFNSKDTLIATLTPTNATNKAVTWTANNENVELVPDGLNCTVKAKAVGNSVVTCTSQDTTNGTISDTCNVTVSESVESDAEIDVEPVYTLSQYTTFNGTSDYIDTGVQLFDTNKDFTIFIDFESSATQNTQASPSSPIPIFHCTYEQSPWPGLSLCNAGSAWNMQSININTLPITDTTRQKYVFTKDALNTLITCYKEDGSFINNSGKQAILTNQTFARNCLLGCYQNTSGTKGRYWTGTIHQFKIWFKKLSDDKINTLLN